jgi:AraC-like DNA-binding protein
LTSPTSLLQTLAISRSDRCEAGLDSGCGPLLPIRASRFARIDVFHYRIPCTTRLLEKRFVGHAINYTIDGSWQYRYRGKWHRLTSGDLNVIGTDEEYGCIHARQHANSSVFLQLLPGALDDGASAIFARPVLHLQIGQNIARAALAPDDDEFDSQIFETFDMVSQLSRPMKDRAGGNRVRVERMKRFIERHYTQSLTLSQIAQSVYLSPFTALRQFKAATRRTPYEYMAYLRIERAKKLLADACIPVSDVADRSGFTTHPHFTRTFRLHTGLTPTEFRRLSVRA